MKIPIFEIEVHQEHKGVWMWQMHSAFTGDHYGVHYFRSYDRARLFALEYCSMVYRFFVRRPIKDVDIKTKCRVKKIKGIEKRGVTVTIKKKSQPR